MQSEYNTLHIYIIHATATELALLNDRKLI